MTEDPVHLNLTSGIVHGDSLTDSFNTKCSFHLDSIITPLRNYHTYKSGIFHQLFHTPYIHSNTFTQLSYVQVGDPLRQGTDINSLYKY